MPGYSRFQPSQGRYSLDEHNGLSNPMDLQNVVRTTDSKHLNINRLSGSDETLPQPGVDAVPSVS